MLGVLWEVDNDENVNYGVNKIKLECNYNGLTSQVSDAMCGSNNIYSASVDHSITWNTK